MGIYFAINLSALGFKFFCSERMKQMTKCILSAKAKEHKCTSAIGLWVKIYIYIERDCCVVNSCHLYVLYLYVSIFVFILLLIVESAVIFSSKMNLIFQQSNYVLILLLIFWNCSEKCWEFGCVYI